MPRVCTLARCAASCDACVRVCVAMGLAAGAQSRGRRDGNGQPPVCRWSGGAREILVSAGPLFVQCAREETRIAGGRFILISTSMVAKKESTLPYTKIDIALTNTLSP